MNNTKCKHKIVTVRLKPQDYDTIRQIADIERLNPTFVMRNAILAYIDYHNSAKAGAL